MDWIMFQATLNAACGGVPPAWPVDAVAGREVPASPAVAEPFAASASPSPPDANIRITGDARLRRIL
ncbi:MAG: hypothetical protein JNM76_08440 [Betaproteobacteria bacterium]|nr:hypothetical protein [Betaproteobacteria bacterium]